MKRGLTAATMAHATSVEGVSDFYLNSMMDQIDNQLNAVLENPSVGLRSITVNVSHFTIYVLNSCGVNSLQKLKLEAAEELSQKGFTTYWLYSGIPSEFARVNEGEAPSHITIKW